jgi:hypothetical protein
MPFPRNSAIFVRQEGDETLVVVIDPTTGQETLRLLDATQLSEYDLAEIADPTPEEEAELAAYETALPSLEELMQRDRA